MCNEFIHTDDFFFHYLFNFKFSELQIKRGEDCPKQFIYFFTNLNDPIFQS